jgi:hypothetical protein
MPAHGAKTESPQARDTQELTRNEELQPTLSREHADATTVTHQKQQTVQQHSLPRGSEPWLLPASASLPVPAVIPRTSSFLKPRRRSGDSPAVIYGCSFHAQLIENFGQENFVEKRTHNGGISLPKHPENLWVAALQLKSS